MHLQVEGEFSRLTQVWNGTVQACNDDTISMQLFMQSNRALIDAIKEAKAKAKAQAK